MRSLRFNFMGGDGLVSYLVGVDRSVVDGCARVGKETCGEKKI